VDKFAVTGLMPEPALHVKAPLIAERPVNIECRLCEILPIGARALAFVGRSYWAVGERAARAFQKETPFE